MRVSVKGGNKNLSKTVVTGEYADLAKKTPTKPILGRENMMSNTQVKAEQKESVSEVIADKNEIRDTRREVRSAISIDPDFKTIDKKFSELAEEIKMRILTKSEREGIMNSLTSLAKLFDIVKENKNEIVDYDYLVNKFKDLKAVSDNDANKFAEYIIDSLDIGVNFKSLYFNDDDRQIMYEIDVYFNDDINHTVWTTDIKLAVDPLALLDPLYDAGYKIGVDSPKDSNDVEFLDQSDFSGNFKYFTSKVINVKDIDQSLQPNKVIAIVNEDGEYLTVNGDIMAIDMVDDRSTQSISIVSKHWLDDTLAELHDLKGEEEMDNNEVNNDEKFINGVKSTD